MLAVSGLIIIMIGAVYTHLKAGDGVKKAAPAFVFGVMLSFLLSNYMHFLD